MSNDTPALNKPQQRPEPALLPPVDVVEDATGITLYADLPGVPKDRLQLNVEGDTLTIEGALGLNVPEGMQPAQAEIGLGRYRRVFTLSKELDAGQGLGRVRQRRAAPAHPQGRARPAAARRSADPVGAVGTWHRQMPCRPLPARPGRGAFRRAGRRCARPSRTGARLSTRHGRQCTVGPALPAATGYDRRVERSNPGP